MIEEIKLFIGLNISLLESGIYMLNKFGMQNNKLFVTTMVLYIVREKGYSMPSLPQPTRLAPQQIEEKRVKRVVFQL